MKLTRKEWSEILLSRTVAAELDRVQQQGVFEAQFPAIQKLVGFGGKGTGHKDLWAHTRTVVNQVLPKESLRWAALFHDVGKPDTFRVDDGVIGFRLHEQASARIWVQEARNARIFTKREIDDVKFLIFHIQYLEAYTPEWSDSAVRRVGKLLGPYMEDVFALARADITTQNPAKRREILGLTRELRLRILAIRKADATEPALPKGLGHAVRERTGATGEALGEILEALRARVVAGELPRNCSDFDVYLSKLD